jgi:hypothetical protein
MSTRSEKSRANHQLAMAEVRHVVTEAKELRSAADGALTDHLATWLAGRYAVAARQMAAENESGAVDWDLLRALCNDLVDLRRGDHSAEALRLERERFEAQRAERKEVQEKQFWEWAKENQAKICQGCMSDEEKEQRMRQILGLSPSDPKPTEPVNGNEGHFEATPGQSNKAK